MDCPICRVFFAPKYFLDFGLIFSLFLVFCSKENLLCILHQFIRSQFNVFCTRNLYISPDCILGYFFMSIIYFGLIASPSTIDKMFEIYTFFENTTEIYTFFENRTEIYTFFENRFEIYTCILFENRTEILSMVDGLTIRSNRHETHAMSIKLL